MTVHVLGTPLVSCVTIGSSCQISLLVFNCSYLAFFKLLEFCHSFTNDVTGVSALRTLTATCGS